MTGAGKGSKGSIALFTIWIIVILAIFCTGLAGGARQKALVFQHLVGRDRLWSFNESAAKSLIDRIRNEPVSLGDTATGKEWYYSRLGKAEKFSLEKGSAECVITDENSRMNVNKADTHLLTNLLVMAAGVDAGTAGRLAAAISDFRDTDDFVTGEEGRGSEKGGSRRDGQAYAPKNGDFEFVEELLLVDGMTREIYGRLAPFVTVYGDGRVNVNTCAKETLLALDLPESIVERILLFRSGTDRRLGTADDAVFTETAAIPKLLSTVSAFTAEEKGALIHAFTQNRFRVTSDFFRGEGRSRIAEPTVTGTFSFVVGTRDGILDWKET